ncbi:MAG: DUF6134 family protein [Pseudomonadota bacterium]|nr:DUF6134 family protein [Pseudomonadota bacterium]
MKRFLYLVVFTLLTAVATAHTPLDNGYKKIEFSILRNGSVVGFSNYYLDRDAQSLTVNKTTHSKVTAFGITLLKLTSHSTELFKDDKLVSFKSHTVENSDEKFVEVTYDKNLKKYLVNGANFKSEASQSSVVGNWWSASIFDANEIISAFTGTVKLSSTKLVGKEKLYLDEKEYSTDHYVITVRDRGKSDGDSSSFDVWYYPEAHLIIKIAFSKHGDWEYIVKNYE